MNDDRMYQKKKQALLELLDMNMPVVIIREILAISESTMQNYFSRVVSMREWLSTTIISLKEAKPKMLLLYAQLHVAPEKVIYTGEKKQLMNALANALEEKKILEVLSYALPSIDSFAQPNFSSDVAMPYQNLIKDLFGQETKGIEQTVWKDWLSQLTEHGTPLVSAESFNWGTNHFVHEIVAAYAEKTRKSLAASYSKEVVVIVGQVMRHALITREYNIVSWYYGFFGERKTYEEIGEIEDGLSRERVRKILSSIKERLKNHLRSELYFSTWQENYLLKIHHQGELERTERLFKEAMLPKSEESKLSVEDYEKLLRPITSFEISTRAEHSFKADQLKYLWEIFQLNREKMKEVRNFGKKSVDEMEKLAHTLGYELGMKFLPAEIAYFEAMTYGKEKQRVQN